MHALVDRAFACCIIVAVVGCDSRVVCPRGLVVDEGSDSCRCPGGLLPVRDRADAFVLDDGGTYVCPGADAGVACDGGCVCSVGTRRTCPGVSEVGACAAGVQSCGDDGTWSDCTGSILPLPETCNAVDDDCDGTSDEGAEADCVRPPHTLTARCTGGACVVATCSPGRADCDGEFATGCEAELGGVDACSSCGDACGWSCSAERCTSVSHVDAGWYFTCVSVTSGQTLCWGANQRGQLGDGTTRVRIVPTLVPEFSARAISSGSEHTCAIDTAGDVWCWGRNAYGQLGDGTLEDRSAPTRTVLAESAVAIAAGRRHTCAMTTTRDVYCWGDNAEGQLGGAGRGPGPVLVLPLARGVWAGASHTCAVDSRGDLVCWGSNSHGQLGTGASAPIGTPSTVALPERVGSMSLGAFHSCAVLDSGALWCWGDNSEGQLGNGTLVGSPTPASVTLVVANVAAGNAHTCGTDRAGATWCWGRNASGQLGDGSTLARLAPTRVLDLDTATSVIAGAEHTCATTSAGLFCWGLNNAGQLGVGTTENSAVPLRVTPTE